MVSCQEAAFAAEVLITPLIIRFPLAVEPLMEWFLTNPIAAVDQPSALPQILPQTLISLVALQVVFPEPELRQTLSQ
jgi:hypothetical protein